MSKKKRRNQGNQVRAAPEKVSFLCSPDAYETLCCTGYTKLSQNPEIMAAVNKIAALISGMTLHLMSNTDNGDVRIKNELSKKLDITPNRFMTRKTFTAVLVRSLLLEGDGNAVVLPVYKNGMLEDLQPIPPEHCTFVPDGYGYHVLVNGVRFEPSEILHYVLNPEPYYPWKGSGYKTTLREVAHNLKQAAETKKGFMESKWKPSMIVKVDALTDEFASKEGRKKLLNEYIESTDAGEPWMIPAEQFEVQEVRPLSLNDIAIESSVRLDKRTVAAILDVPPFVVGEGSFDADEWNNFISTRIRDICNAIEQENTKKLLISPDWFFRFNIRSLFAYDIEKLSRVGDDNYTRGIMTGNEVRDWLGLSPKDGLDELIILENYIPQGMIGDQNKLKGGDG
ncbi:MAG: phage portal protein [Ruminococcaceae bacterium]|nr:phage portal protein [Oscillospiraceae bacterium]